MKYQESKFELLTKPTTNLYVYKCKYKTISQTYKWKTEIFISAMCIFLFFRYNEILENVA